MTAQPITPSRFRYQAAAYLACLVFIGLSAVSASAQAAQTQSPQTISLCVKRAGPDKGGVRFTKSKRCKQGEQLFLVLSNSGQQGVLGVEATSGATRPSWPGRSAGPPW